MEVITFGQSCEFNYNNIKKINELYRRQPINIQISLVFICSALSVLIIMAISLSIQYKNVQNAQHQIPNKFFDPHNRYSLQSITSKIKNLMLVIIDFRVNFISSIYNNIISNQSKYSPIGDLGYSKDSYKVSCELTKPNASIFNCGMDHYTKVVMEAAWPLHVNRQAGRRFNIIYQNVHDRSDVMAKSIARFPDFVMRDTERVKNKLNELKQNYVKLSIFYPDEYGTLSENLLSFSTKIVNKDYEILIQLESFGDFIFYTISRVFYTNNTNIVMLSLNDSSPLKYNFVTSFKEVTNELNFTNLLKLGFQQTSIQNNKTMYSFTTPFSSQYSLGSVNYHSNETDSKLVIIVYSMGFIPEMKANIDKIIKGLNSSLNTMLGAFFFTLIALFTVISLVLSCNIGSLILNAGSYIRNYTRNPSNYFQVISSIQIFSYTDHLIRPIMQTLERVIRSIEVKKRRFRNICKTPEYDKYPLNMFESSFMERQAITDELKLAAIRAKLSRKIRKMSQQSAHIKIQ